jgi:hypothetical protein
VYSDRDGRYHQQLTDEQQRLLGELCAEWKAAALSTEPADRPGAEAGVRLAYRQAGFAPPATMLWVDSPRAGVVLASLLTQGRDWQPSPRPYRDLVPWAEVADRVRVQADRQFGSQVWPDAGAALDDLVTRSGGDRYLEDATDDILVQAGTEWIDELVETAFGRVGLPGPVDDGIGTVDDLYNEIGCELSDWAVHQLDGDAWPAVHKRIAGTGRGQHEGLMLTYALLLREVRPDVAHLLAVDGVAQVSRCAGAWSAFTNVAVISERSSELHLDAQLRLHRTDGPVVRYPDGFEVWDSASPGPGRTPRQLS